ncbi:hypothetical protein [Clostridium butyricum]|uniref:hypothetical protein n=1 Tax=Clostridium butyricum TaxID=1492 RepID=UPI002ABE6CC2|nr:hypothetical protein [Clostridium butyricum]
MKKITSKGFYADFNFSEVSISFHIDFEQKEIKKVFDLYTEYNSKDIIVNSYIEALEGVNKKDIPINNINMLRDSIKSLSTQEFKNILIENDLIEKFLNTVSYEDAIELTEHVKEIF